MQQSGLLKLNRNDYVKGLITATLSGAWGAVSAIVLAVGFDMFTADFKHIGGLALFGAIAGAMGYLNKNAVTDNDKHETVAGIIPTK